MDEDDDDEDGDEEEKADNGSWERCPAESTKLDDEFTAKVDQATAAKFVGVARAVNQMCSSVVYGPSELSLS